MKERTGWDRYIDKDRMILTFESWIYFNYYYCFYGKKKKNQHVPNMIYMFKSYIDCIRKKIKTENKTLKIRIHI